MSDTNEMLYRAMNNFQQEMNMSKWQLNMENELYKFKISIMGLVANEFYGIKVDGVIDMREYIPMAGANLVNERGATAIYNKLSAELTKISSDTNLDKSIIEVELMAFECDFPVWLAQNHEDFELSDKDYNTICEIAVRLLKAALYRSLGGWKGNLINNNIQQREVITNNVPNQTDKPKLFGFMGR